MCILPILNSLKSKLILLIMTPVGLFLLVVYFYVLPVYESDIYEEKKNHAKQMVNSTMGIMENYYKLEQSGILTRQEAQQSVIDLIYQKRFGADQLDYFWIHDFDARIIVHPLNPELKGQDLSDLRDPDGVQLVSKMVRLVKNQGAGFVEYQWQYYDETGRLEPKISYVEGFEPWEWILGTGVYVHDVEATVAKTSNNILLAVALATVALLLAGYYFIRLNITVPLAKVMSVANGLARGDLQQDKIDIDASGEIDELARVFNILIDNLGKMARQAKNIPPLKAFSDSAGNFTTLESSTILLDKGDELKELSEAFNVMSSSLKRTTVFLRKIIDSMQEMLIVIDPDGLIQKVNKATYETLGYSQEKLEGEPLEVIVEGFETGFVEETGYRQREKNIKSKSGELIPVLLSFAELNMPGEKSSYVCVATDITKRKQIEEKLLQSEKQFKTFFDKSPISILIHDKDSGKIIDANPEAWERYGFESYQELKNGIAWIESPYSRDDALKKIRKTVKAGPQNFEWRTEDKDGNCMWEHIQLRLIKINGVKRVMAVITDITGLKEKEKELQAVNQQLDAYNQQLEAYTQQLEATEQQLRAEIKQRKELAERLLENKNFLNSVVETQTGLVVVLESEGNIVRFNSAGESVTGYDAEEVIGKKVWDIFILDEEKQEVKKVFKSLLAKDYPNSHENFWKTKDGELRRIAWDNNVIMDDEDNVQYVVATGIDITELREKEEELNRSQQLMEHIIKHDPNAIAVLDEELNFVFVSDRFRKDYEVENKEIIGRHHYEVFPDIPQKWREIHQRALDGEILSAEKERFERLDGSVDWTRWQCRPWYKEEESIGGIILYTEVITERVEQENEIRAVNQQLKAYTQQLETTEKKLKKSLQQKNILLKEVHHRVKNNLFMIISILELQQFENETPEMGEMLTQIINRIHSMALIHQKIYSEENMEKLDFSDYLRSLVDGLVDSYRKPDQEIEVSYDLQSVAMDLDHTIPCGLVVNEIVSNALQHGFADQKECALEINLFREEDEYSIEIENNGHPLPADFDIDDNASLGLRLVKILICDQLGGRVKVDKNGDTIFTITFPADITNR